MNGRDARAHATATLWTRRPGGRRGFGAPLATLLLALCVLLCLLGAAVAAGAAPASAPLRPAAQGLQLLPLTFSFGSGGAALTPAAARACTSPARPATQAPKGTITALRPTFRWRSVAGASRYDLRIYQGRRVLRTVNRISCLLYTSDAADE